MCFEQPEYIFFACRNVFMAADISIKQITINFPVWLLTVHSNERNALSAAVSDATHVFLLSETSVAFATTPTSKSRLLFVQPSRLLLQSYRELKLAESCKIRIPLNLIQSDSFSSICTVQRFYGHSFFLYGFFAHILCKYFSK